ncbi:MAG: hypothetical protein WKF97_13915 [Chitinophagaceae bacterium]
MGHLTDLVNRLVKHANSSSSENGICYLEITAQYLYPSGITGSYFGIVSTPVKCSEAPNNWILPSCGILKFGFGHTETSTKANLNFIAKAIEEQSFATLITFDKNIRHTAKNIKIIPGGLLIGETGIQTEIGRLTIGFNPVKTPWGL